MPPTHKTDTRSRQGSRPSSRSSRPTSTQPKWRRHREARHERPHEAGAGDAGADGARAGGGEERDRRGLGGRGHGHGQGERRRRTPRDRHRSARGRPRRPGDARRHGARRRQRGAPRRRPGGRGEAPRAAARPRSARPARDVVLFAELAQTSVAVAETRARSAKIDLLATCLDGLLSEEVPAALMFLSGTLSRIGVGWAALRDLPTPPAVATVESRDVDRALERIASTSGRGSQGTRRRALEDVFALATEPEQRFLRGILPGELRQGALEGVMVEAVARAAEVSAAAVRRALMLAGELPPVA